MNLSAFSTSFVSTSGALYVFSSSSRVALQCRGIYFVLKNPRRGSFESHMTFRILSLLIYVVDIGKSSQNTIFFNPMKTDKWEPIKVQQKVHWFITSKLTGSPRCNRVRPCTEMKLTPAAWTFRRFSIKNFVDLHEPKICFLLYQLKKVNV